MASQQSLTQQLNEILTEYEKEVNEVSNGTMKKVSQETVADLKNTSPKRKGAYARDWAVKAERGAGGSMIYTVHNRKHYQLTHLLENGHVIKNKKGEFGRAPAHPHIKPARDRAETKLINELEKKL